MRTFQCYTSLINKTKDDRASSSNLQEVNWLLTRLLVSMSSFVAKNELQKGAYDEGVKIILFAYYALDLHGS